MIALRAGTSGLLLPARFTQALELVAKLSPSAPRGAVRGQELRLGIALSLDDGACAGFVLDFAGQGARVSGEARGPSAALLAWALHAVAATIDCELTEDDVVCAASPERHREAAIEYLTAYESEVLAARRARSGLDGDAFVAWLAREEHVALSDIDDESFAELPLDDAEAVYEALLESDRIDEVFASEREVARLLARFLARGTT